MWLKKNFKIGFILCMTIIMMAVNTWGQSVVLVVGAGGQVGGEIILAETEVGMFQKGELVFSIASKNSGIYLDDVQIEVSGGLKGVKSEVKEGKNGTVTVSISRTSKEIATIKLSQFVFTTDRTVPEGSYDLEISGDAINTSDDKIVVEDFIQITTPNTEDLGKGDIARGKSGFIVGEQYYLNNTNKVQMDAVPYIEGEGYIMVPLRYVAQAFNIVDENILFSNETVTLFIAGRTISLTNGSNEMILNGNSVTMDVPMVIQDNRAYLPVGQIANLLSIKVQWDNETKTAYFISE